MNFQLFHGAGTFGDCLFSQWWISFVFLHGNFDAKSWYYNDFVRRRGYENVLLSGFKLNMGLTIQWKERRRFWR